MQPDKHTLDSANTLTPLSEPMGDNDDALPALSDVEEALSLGQISQVMNPERLAALLAQADAFGVVNSEALDDF